MKLTAENVFLSCFLLVAFLIVGTYCANDMRSKMEAKCSNDYAIAHADGVRTVVSAIKDVNPTVLLKSIGTLEVSRDISNAIILIENPTGPAMDINGDGVTIHSSHFICY